MGNSNNIKYGQTTLLIMHYVYMKKYACLYSDEKLYQAVDIWITGISSHLNSQ